MTPCPAPGTPVTRCRPHDDPFQHVNTTLEQIPDDLNTGLIVIPATPIPMRRDTTNFGARDDDDCAMDNGIYERAPPRPSSPTGMCANEQWKVQQGYLPKRIVNTIAGSNDIREEKLCIPGTPIHYGRDAH